MFAKATFRRVMSATLGLFVLSAPATYAQDQVDHFEGLYRPATESADLWNCDPTYLGQVGGVLGVVDGYFEGAENRCALSNPRRAAGGRTVFDAACSAEGGTDSTILVLGRTPDGITIGPIGNDVRWTRCEGAPQPVAGTDTWSFDGTSAVTVQRGMAFNLSCETLNASSTYTTATLIGYCSGCIFGEVSNFTIQTDQGFSQTFDFELRSQADGWQSGLDYYPNWFDGLVPALMSGSRMSIHDENGLVAQFSLDGSARAIEALRQRCR